MSNPVKLISILIAASILATFTATASLSTVMAKRLPERAVELPVVDGDAYASLAMSQVELAQGGANRESRELMVRAATQAFRLEPTNSVAISLLALGRNLDGDTVGARRLYMDSLALSQRDRLANLSLIEDASARGQIAFILDRYDVLLRTGGATSAALLDVLATALKDDTIVPYIEESLTDDPPWAQSFWLRVAQKEEAIRNLGRLRLRLLDRNVSNPAANDNDIVWRLASAGHLDLAYQLFAKASAPQTGQNNLLRNGEFNEAPDFAPFDWVTYSDSRYAAEVDPVIGALMIFTETSSEALLARQLIRLPSGQYSFTLSLQGQGAEKSTALSVRIRCADSSLPLLSTEMSTGDFPIRQVFSHASGCDYAWVELWARQTPGSNSTSPEDIAVDSIVLARIASASSTQNKKTTDVNRTSGQQAR